MELKKCGCCSDTMHPRCIAYNSNTQMCNIRFSMNCNSSPYTKEELLLGPVLLKKREPAYLAYCERMIKKIDLIIKQSNGNAFQMSDLETDRSIYKKYIEN